MDAATSTPVRPAKSNRDSPQPRDPDVPQPAEPNKPALDPMEAILKWLAFPPGTKITFPEGVSARDVRERLLPPDEVLESLVRAGVDPGPRNASGEIDPSIFLESKHAGPPGDYEEIPTPPGFGMGMRVVPIPKPPTGFMPAKQPLYDRQVLAVNSEQAAFFRSPRDPSGYRSNVLGEFGCMPAAHHYYLYGITLIPDAATASDDLLKVWNEGVLEFRFASRVHLTIPCRDVMLDPKELPISEDEISNLAHSDKGVRDLTVSGRPIEIVALEDWSVYLRAPVNRKDPLGFMCVLYGILLAPNSPLGNCSLADPDTLESPLAPPG